MTRNHKNSEEEILILLSNQSELEKVETLSTRISKKVALTEEKSDNLAIALTELVNNAILHGNKNQPDKKVIIKVFYHNNYVRISVKDQGNGFDPAKLADPRDPENLWKDSGRGIFLVRNLVDKVEFNSSPEGMEIIITQNLK
jgi:serine/threonine-protein kinase RsbW